MATAYPDDPTPPSAGAAPVRGARAAMSDRRLRLEDVLKLMVADGLILPADAERIARSRTQRFEHPLELIAEQKLKSLKPPHKALALELLVEWLAGKLGVPYRHIDPLKVELGAVTATMSNAYAERWVQTVRAECLDWTLVLGRRHLLRVLREYVRHYNQQRPHRGLVLAVPEPQEPSSPHVNPRKVGRRDVLGGLIHEYHEVAA